MDKENNLSKDEKIKKNNSKKNEKKEDLKKEKTNIKEESENSKDEKIPVVTEEKIEVKTKEENGILKKIIIIVVAILMLIVVGKTIYNAMNKDKGISDVKRLLKEKYTSVDCIDSSCNGFIVVDGDKLSKYKIILYNTDGKKVANYKVNYNSENKTTEVPKEIGDSYYISATMDIKNIKISKYSIRNKRGKVVFETKNDLSILNDNFILMKDSNNAKSKYTILTKKGKTKYSNISNIQTYLNGNYIVIEVDNTYTILNSKGEKILTNYKIRKVVKDDNGKELYAIVGNTVDNVFNYYSFLKEKIIGDSFYSYSNGYEDGELIITKKENDNKVKYSLSKNGKQTKIETTDEAIKKIKEKIDSDKYKVYENSIYSSEQKEVLVDSKENKSFGLLNLKNNNFNEIYKYKSDKSQYYSTVTKMDSVNEKDLILSIMCSSYCCDKKQSIIYNAKDNKELYKIEDMVVSSYLEYEDGYKIVKYAGDRSNSYANKTIVLDKSNKELEEASSNINIIDKKLIYGKESNYSNLLYSVKKGKLISEQKATLEKIGDNKVYKYTDKNNNKIILNSTGKEIIRVSEDDYLKSSDGNYIYIKDKVLYIYNVEKDKIYKYKIKDNEKLNDASGDIINPYKGSIFVNNSSDKYIKVLNFKGRQIKKINKVEISSVEFNEKNEKAFIIVKKNTDDGSLYGLYVAE